MAGLGIYHYGARFYSPKLGRFISADTIVPGYANPQNLNRYSYVLNNPLRYTDPTGHMQASDDYKDSDGKCDKGDKGCNNLKSRIERKRRDKNKVFHTSFQMFQAMGSFTYGESAEEGFTDFPGGGEPQYAPRVYGQQQPRTAALPGSWFPLFNDFGIGFRPIYERNNNPYDQKVYLTYATTVQNTTSVNPTSVITLNNIAIFNGSNSIDSAINYTINIRVGYSKQDPFNMSLGPGQPGEVTVPSGYNIYNGVGGIDISIAADTVCPSVCYTDPNNSIDFFGNLNFNFNP